jgi:hypothetical protein
VVAAVALALAALDAAESALAITDPPLTPKEKRHAAKLRKGGEKYVVQIGSLAAQYKLETAAMDVATLPVLVGKADALQPLADRLAALGKRVGDCIFAAQSQAWDTGMQYYALLKRVAKSNGELATALQPVTDFLAYRHPSTKPAPGQPTTRQVNAAKKAQQKLAKVAAGKLAGTNLLTPRKKAAQTAAPPPSPAPAPAPSPAPAATGNGAPAPAASPAANGNGTPAAHS